MAFSDTIHDENPVLDFTVFRNVINNKLTSTAQTRHSINPANRSANFEVPLSTLDDVEQAVAAARAAFKTWSIVSVEERRGALVDFAEALDSFKDNFAQLLTMEQGKPLSQSYSEVRTAVEWLKAISSVTLSEDIIEETEDRQIINRYVPLGVACGIVPWNAPILLACGKIASALYTGNTIIIKPSPFTPYCDLKLGELGIRFFPPGVLQVLSGGDDLGPMLASHPDIDKISFTGSSDTGKKVLESCAKTLKRVTLELGGNDPAIICDDVDIDAIIPKPYNSLLPYKLSLAEAFACILMTESGSFDLDPSSLKHVITIVSGNSVYIADQLLYDPLYDDSPRRISRVAGSLGRPGIVLLVPPQRPMVRPSNEGVWQSISHNAFDGKLENSFRETTLHLGFTDWKLPIDIGKHGLRDAEIYFLEALVSVHDHGEWVADLDILGCLRNRNLSRLRASLETCINDSSELHRQSGEAETSGFISIDNWEELL